MRTGTKLDAIRFDALLRSQRPLDDQGGVFDLREYTFISPSALVQLAAACETVCEAGRAPVIRVVAGPLAEYLLRMGLPLALHERVIFDPPFSPREVEGGRFYHGSTNRLIEVTRIDAERDLGHVLDRLVGTLRDDFEYPDWAAFDVATAVSEVGQNVFHHNEGLSGCETTSAFVAMQEFQSGPDAFLEIGVADGGAGLLASLRRGSATADISGDLDAILQAAKLGVSRFDDATRGQGLARLLEKVATHRGSVQIRSGRGVVRYRADRSQGRAFTVPLLPGVQIALSLPAQTGQNRA